jgi:hypothetical protein
MKPTRDFYRPKSYTAKFCPRDLPGVEVFSYEEENKLFAVGFSGKRQKPDFHHRFLSSETREAFVRAYFESLRENYRYKRIQALKKQGKAHPFKVGDILTGSWGYDQTNQEFFQVTRKTKKSVWVREIGARHEGTSGQQDALLPDKDAFRGEEQRKVPQTYDGGSWTVSFSSFSLSLWEGRIRWQTASGFGH